MGNLALEGLTHEKNKLAKGNKGGTHFLLVEAYWGTWPTHWREGMGWWVRQGWAYFHFFHDGFHCLFSCFELIKHKTIIASSHVSTFFLYIFLYIFIFSTNPCSNYLKSWGAWIFLVLFSYFTERHHMVMGQGDVRCSLVSSTPLITS